MGFTNEHLLSQYIFTLGEAINLCPGLKSDVIDYIANIIDPEFIKTGKRKTAYAGYVF